MLCCINGSYDRRIICCCNGERGTAMEGAAKGNDLFPAGMEGGQLQRIFIGFGAGIAKK